MGYANVNMMNAMFGQVKPLWFRAKNLSLIFESRVFNFFLLDGAARRLR